MSNATPTLPSLAHIDADRAPWMSQEPRIESAPVKREASQGREHPSGRVEALLRRHAALVHEIE